jgi:putative transcriptional regulator
LLCLATLIHYGICRIIVNGNRRIFPESIRIMNPEWFAGRLKELRTAKGWTQGELAEKAQLSKAGIADLEQGRRVPSWPTVLALGSALGVKCDEFQKPAADTELPDRGRPTKDTAKPVRVKKKR